MEKHSDPVLCSGLRPYQVLSSASAVKCCPMLSDLFQCYQQFSKDVRCCQTLSSVVSPPPSAVKCQPARVSQPKIIAPKSHTPTSMTPEQNRGTLSKIEEHREILRKLEVDFILVFQSAMKHKAAYNKIGKNRETQEKQRAIEKTRDSIGQQSHTKPLSHPSCRKGILPPDCSVSNSHPHLPGSRSKMIKPAKK